MEVKQILKKIIEIPSPYPFEIQLGQWIVRYLENLEFSVTKISVDNRFNIVATKGNNSNNGNLLLFGHIDTVPIQSVEDLNPHRSSDREKIIEQAKALGWRSDPYTPYIKDGKMFGSGAIDMKAGVAAILTIAQRLPSSWFKDNTLVIALTVAEEHLSQGMYELVKSGVLKNKNIKACISTEILDITERLTVKTDEELPGPETILIGRRGRLAIEVEVKGKAAHAATPKAGVNAIEEATRLINHILGAIDRKELKLREHSILPQATLTPLEITAGTSSLSIPSSCKIIFDRHLVPPETPKLAIQELKAFIKGIIPKIDVNIKKAYRPVPFLLPFVTPYESPIVRLVKEVLEKKGKEPIIRGGSSVADENMLASDAYDQEIKHNIPTVILGCRGSNYHSSNEWVDLKSLNELVDILLSTCKQWKNIKT